ncbi:Insertion sequence IS5376 putative ATP-binding protein [Acidipropionibacterium virtanenii]|uniref:Insertion sequence IS5376 putative ATP-binding protein n=2 Tax=Acidipropionibacterium virtanenii TaxID=2057246 RepID=A0A344UW18_9ACTN|nr:Insertion sequence IS5376 putative ATP-binding protein [Acidipropionibacterium virtanenii]
MSTLNIETKRKLREMGAAALLEAIEAQDDALAMHLPFEDRLQILVDEAHSSFANSKVEGLIRRAGLRYPNADLRRLDLVTERGLDQTVINQFATCSFITRNQNVVFQGFTGSGKSYLGCALAKQACQHRLRAHYIRMPDLAEAWVLAQDKPQGVAKFLRKYTSYSLLVLDEWLLDEPDEAMRSMLLELLERRYDAGSTVFCTQYAKKDWHHRLGSGVHADAIMDRIVHNTIWFDTGNHNMREHTAPTPTPVS